LGSCQSFPREQARKGRQANSETTLECKSNDDCQQGLPAELKSDENAYCMPFLEDSSLFQSTKCQYYCNKFGCGKEAVCQRNSIKEGDVECYCPQGTIGNPKEECFSAESLFANIKDLKAEVSPASVDYANTIHDFSQNMLLKLPGDEARNKVFSPFSLHITLAMLTSGSTDQSATQEELLEALGRYRDIGGLESHYKGLLKEYMNEVDTHPMSFGNKVWAFSENYEKINQTFINKIGEIYHAEVGILRKTNAASDVNNWVKKTTKGKLDQLVDDVPADTVLMLTNALHFKANWDYAFDFVSDFGVLGDFEEDNLEFTGPKGKLDDVTFMTRKSNTLTALRMTVDEISFHAVSLPYEYDDGRFEMIVLVPTNEIDGIEKLGEFLKKEEEKDSFGHTPFNIFDEMVEEIDKRKKNTGIERPEVDLFIPQFKLASTYDIIENLKKLGITAPFIVGDFDKISKEVKMRVTNVKHKAMVEIDTQGTEATAATNVEIAALSGSDYDDEPVTRVVVDKPFAFMIRDRIASSVLFVGVIHEPK